uniref:Thioredoxin domain-containing protein n=1 Tax=Strigamia maritima TaxID=126957 RepID=T1JIB0_STRMM
MQHIVRNTTTLLTQTSKSKFIHTSSVLRDIFTIQDTNDFKKRVLQSDTPVLVDFYADWCAPCKNLTPRLEKIVSFHGTKLHLAKVNVDQHTDLAMEYDVTAVPAIVGMNKGVIVDRVIGLQDDDKLTTFAKRVME